MASVSLEEKRLKQLKQQLFGKEQPVSKTEPEISLKPGPHISRPDSSINIINPLTLKNDLTKIALLSILALGIQFSLFLANRAGVIRLFH